MSELLIFGGTTEGRLLAEFCVREEIPAEVCVATELGASLLPEMPVRTGRLDAAGMTALLQAGKFRTAVDATHPYAAEATRNIRAACTAAGVRYFRLLRERSEISGDAVADMQELTAYLNRFDGVILSTLGSKAIPTLAEVDGFAERLWLRVLEGALPECRRLGFPEAHIVTGKPPFSTEQNLLHLRQSGAELLVTKESGSTGGYPEKMEAAKLCGIRTLTLLREPENGYDLQEMIHLLTEGP